ncbi:MAG: CDP-alcohol phosphatidyltransferase family protein [Desulfobacterales bacterium]|nr:MAG: CDP-alcohol phosphatidyltransferase family protein [Desulfobacterales bacterium]
MSIYAHIINDSPVKHWGLTSRQRVLRVLNSAGVANIVDDIADVPQNSAALLVRGDYLFDDRVINYLVQNPNILLRVPEAQTSGAVAAHVGSGLARQALELLKESPEEDGLTGVKTETLETLSLSFQQRLLKFEPPFVLPITPENRRILERRLFDWSYKGVTDFITKWIWPHPARWVVGQCVNLGFSPNHVTIIGLVLVVIAGVLFADGRYGWGLLAAWLMTFLDTVDGKLARVTVTSSKFGHYFDHIIDLIHPPAWYILWGVGLKASQFNEMGLSLNTALWLIVAGYIAGRLAEGVFLAWLGKFGIFCWRPIDSYFRLITARRNPCLVVLTLGALVGRPDWGLFGVTVWTVVTSVFLIIRLLMALYTHRTAGGVRSWFLDIDPARQKQPLAARLFTHRATG